MRRSPSGVSGSEACLIESWTAASSAPISLKRPASCSSGKRLRYCRTPSMPSRTFSSIISAVWFSSSLRPASPAAALETSVMARSMMEIG